jgi:hypothetical protein
MILSDIKRYLIRHKQATLADIALHCDAEPDAVRGMLEQWIRKGKVVRSQAGSACGGGCNRCDPATVEIYHWVEGGERPDSSEGLIEAGRQCPD